MRDNDGIKVHRPFGPVLCEFRMSKNTVDTLNNFVDGVKTDIPRDKLQRLFAELYTEAQSMDS